MSDRNLKENVEMVDGNEVLARLAEIPIAKWNYTSQDESIRHIGPMAQDFHAAFGLGPDQTHIADLDLGGVSLAAIQGLYKLVQEENARLKMELDAKAKTLEAMQHQLDEISARLDAAAKN